MGSNGFPVYDLILGYNEALPEVMKEFTLSNGLQAKRVVIQIPPKVKDEALFRVTTDGREGLKGDVYLRIRIKQGNLSPGSF